MARAVGEAFPAGVRYRLGSRITRPIDDAQIDTFIECGDAMPPGGTLYVHHSHGAATRAPVESTAYAYRDEHLVVETIGMWIEGDGAAECAWVTEAGRRLDSIAEPGGWANVMASDDPHAREAYGPNTARLLAAKARYDPGRVFDASPLP